MSVQFSSSVVSDSLRPHELEHARPPCPSPTPGVHSDSRPLSQWRHPAISSSVVPFSSRLQSFPALWRVGSFFPPLGHAGSWLWHMGSSSLTRDRTWCPPPYPHPLHWKHRVLTTGPPGNSSPTLALRIKLFVGKFFWDQTFLSERFKNCLQ